MVYVRQQRPIYNISSYLKVCRGGGATPKYQSQVRSVGLKVVQTASWEVSLVPANKARIRTKTVLDLEGFSCHHDLVWQGTVTRKQTNKEEWWREKGFYRSNYRDKDRGLHMCYLSCYQRPIFLNNISPDFM